MLHTHLANRPEALVAALAALQRVDPLPLFEAETVVVPSTGLARWLQFRLADALGIATRIAFAFPAAHVWELIGRVLVDVAAVNPFDRATMQWRLLSLLEASRIDAVRHYLEGDDGTRCFELAGQVAALFDRYLVERPDWIAAWSAGKQLGLGADEAWQSLVWQALLTASPRVAEEHPRERFISALRARPELRDRLPHRLSLFCVEAMPALYWEVFAALAEWIDLHVFVLSPCREYWGDIEQTRQRLRLEIDRPEAAALYDTGHPLLASLGRARQPATVRLADTAAQTASAEHAYFSEPPETLLGQIKRDLLELAPSGGHRLDVSLQIHDCHGAQREAEVLLDRLLERFETLPDLQPADILILTPDIETYGPVIAAVLTNAPRERRIPCAIADRPLATLPLWRTLRQLCMVAMGELDAESVMALLDEPALRRAFAIDENQLPHLRDWVVSAGIRWGIDAASRTRRGLPADDAHGWRAGLRRLLLGVALPDAPERLWQGMLAMPGIEGERADLLGRFVDFAEALFEFSAKVGAGPSQADAPPVGGSGPGLRARGANKLGAGRTASEWCRLLAATQERFLAPDEAEEAQTQRLRTALAQIDALAQATQCAVRLPLAVLLRELDDRLAGQASAQAFISGSATIAALQPGRPVAARIVCLVGMNDGAWPRPAPPSGFDLMAAHPRSGDRNRRGEERYAFLESLLCAGDALIVTYTGRDPRSNLALPPAAPLAELLDTVAAMTGVAAAESVLRHPLQPFGEDYYSGTDERLFSYDAEHCPLSASTPATPFSARGCVMRDPDEREIELAELQRFFAHPVRYYLRERLGIHLEESEELLPTHEPFIPDRLDAYRLREAQFAGLAAGAPADEADALLRARGWLPQGIAGELAARAARKEALPLWAASQPWREAQQLSHCTVEFAAAGCQLSARLDGLTAHGLWRVRHGRLRARDRLRLWLDHLLLNIAAPPGVPRVSTLIARDELLRFAAEPAAAEILTDLLALFRDGAARVLPFYPETAWAWQAQQNWGRAWEGDSFNGKPGERDDPYIRLALRDSDDVRLGDEFQSLARRVFAPIKENLGDG